jgi:hypothetical protein
VAQGRGGPSAGARSPTVRSPAKGEAPSCSPRQGEPEGVEDGTHGEVEWRGKGRGGFAGSSKVGRSPSRAESWRGTPVGELRGSKDGTVALLRLRLPWRGTVAKMEKGERMEEDRRGVRLKDEGATQ